MLLNGTLTIMLKCKGPINLSWKFLTSSHIRLTSNYVQGQSPERGIREYFYYIDHQGMLYLDDARMKNFTSCFKEKHFLKFFRSSWFTTFCVVIDQMPKVSRPLDTRINREHLTNF